MKIRITAPGCFGAKGEIEVGTEFEVKAAPKGWEGRYIVLGKGGDPVNTAKQAQAPAPEQKQAITNPAQQPQAPAQPTIDDDVSKMTDEELSEEFKTALGKAHHPQMKRENIEAAIREARKKN